MLRTAVWRVSIPLNDPVQTTVATANAMAGGDYFGPVWAVTGPRNGAVHTARQCGQGNTLHANGASNGRKRQRDRALDGGAWIPTFSPRRVWDRPRPRPNGRAAVTGAPIFTSALPAGSRAGHRTAVCILAGRTHSGLRPDALTHSPRRSSRPTIGTHPYPTNDQPQHPTLSLDRHSLPPTHP